MSRKIIERLPKGGSYGFDNLMIDGLKSKLSIQARPFDGFWLDIGRPEDYDFANENYAQIKTKLGF